MLKKLFVGGFIALFALSLLPLSVSAANIVPAGSLIKGSGPGVYYFGADSKRYIFPNEKTFNTWFSSFNLVTNISDASLASIAIGGNITYKPGVKLIKITTDPKVYYVDKNGTLRWVQTEALAQAIYGSSWNSYIEDVPDVFFVSYMIGLPITTPEITPIPTGYTINQDRGLSNNPDPNYAATISLSGYVSGTTASLSWSHASLPTMDGYVVLASTQPNPIVGSAQMHTISGDVNAGTDTWTGLTESTYYFRVCQLVNGQCGIYSNNLILLPGMGR